MRHVPRVPSLRHDPGHVALALDENALPDAKPWCDGLAHFNQNAAVCAHEDFLTGHRPGGVVCDVRTCHGAADGARHHCHVAPRSPTDQAA